MSENENGNGSELPPTEQQKENKTQEASEKNSQKVQQAIKSASKKGAMKQSLMAALSHVLIYVFAAIVILIIIIGLIMFFVTMPGMVMEKIKALAKEVGDKVASWFGQNSAEQVEDEQIYGVLDYLEQMGYDLKGQGFLTDYVGEDDSGVEKNEDGMISNAKSDFIFAYLVSENYLYTIKNFNTDTSGKKWSAIWDHLSALWSDNLDKRTGMLVFFHENGGEIGSTSDNSYDAWERGSITAEASSKKLSIKKGWTNSPMVYNLDGWTGRYGMPIDFLISVQLATLMPDLAYDMYDTFHTEIKILLHETTGSVIGVYKSDSGYVEYQDVAEAIDGFAGKNIFSQIWNSIDDWGLNAGEAQKMIDLGIVPEGHNPPDCGCEVSETYTYEGVPVYKENDEYFYYKYDDVGGVTKEKITKDQLSEDDKITTLTKVGDNCKEYLKAVVKYMKGANDYKYSTYVPYIENVTDHWYRDVYFITNSNVKNFVDYDYEYEAMMKERWTLYETYDAKSDKAGEYKLYAINSSGDYAKSESQIENYDSSKFEKSGDYYLFKGTQAEANNAKIKVAKKAETVDMSSVYEDLNWNDLGNGVYSAYSKDENLTPDYQQVYKSDNAEANKIYNDADEITKKALDRIYSVVNIGNITQTGEGQRTETNTEIKKMFLQNNYFRYDGSAETAEIITALRDKMFSSDDTERYGAIDKSKIKSEDGTDLTYNLDFSDKKYTSEAKNGEYKASDYIGNVSLNQDSLNAFSMLENTHTLDADYIYRDFKELIVELGYFTKEELTDETPRLLQWIVPDIGSGGYPKRSIDKRENEYGTMIHSKGDIDANEKYTLMALMNKVLESQAEANGTLDSSSNSSNQQISGMTLNNKLDVKKSMLNGMVKGLEGEKDPSQVSVEELLTKAREMMEEMQSKTYAYCILGKEKNPGFSHTCELKTTYEESKTQGQSTVCCATYVSWVLQEVGLFSDSQHTDSAQGVVDIIKDVEGIEVLTEWSELQPGDILFFSDEDSNAAADFAADAHVEILGENIEGSNFTYYNAGHYISSDRPGIQEKSDWGDSHPYHFAVRLPLTGTAKSGGNPYEGYEGNEAVVSPVTGVLLEYGTYTDEDIDSITNEEYRVNVDLKYGQPNNVNSEKYGEEGSGESTPKPETPSEEKQEIVSDKVGYAKILVLDAENYQKLESLTQNSWREDSLINVKENTDSESSKKVLANYSEKLETIEQMDEEHENWSAIDKTIYGYKEFAESYEKYGISGYVVYMDGFVCELPDENISNEQESDSEESIAEQLPQGKPLTIDSFKIDQSQLDKIDELEVPPQSKYEKDEEYKLASKKVTERLNAESAVKDEAGPAINVNDNGNDLIFIKEGTVLGRTMTDKELNTKIRKDPTHPYEYYRPDTSSTSSDSQNEDTETDESKLIGNYIRVIMRDLDGTVVENVEDYMKLDEEGDSFSAVSQEYKAWDGDLEALAEAFYHESGGWEGYLIKYNVYGEEEAEYNGYCMGYSIVNKVIPVNKDTHYGSLYDESRTDMSPLVQVLTNQKSVWYGNPIPDEVMKVHNGGPGCYSAKDLEFAEYCLKYDCTSVKKPFDNTLSAYATSIGYTTTPKGSTIPQIMCQQGGLGDGASGQEGIILTGYEDINKNGQFDKGDELWGVDRMYEDRIK